MLIATICVQACTTKDAQQIRDFPAAATPELHTPSLSVPVPDAPAGPTPGEAREGYHAWSNGAGLRYEGNWQDGRFEGQGTLQEPDGSSYTGEWLAGKRNGSGRQYYPDGSYHDGSWELNQPQGPGTRKTIEGLTFTGLWSDTVIANGLLELPSGHVYAGPLYDGRGRKVSGRLLAWLEALSNRGDRYAQYLLADCYGGFVEPQPDDARRQTLLRRSAEQGFAPAQLALAELSSGEEAQHWLRKAADGHLPAALHRLALSRHAAGDRAQAYALAERAMQRGWTAARRQLAWWLATDPEADTTSGADAVALIRDIAITTAGWQYLDTLAAAQARAGDIPAAVATQDLAIRSGREAAVPEDTLAALLERRAAYARGAPFRVESEEHP